MFRCIFSFFKFLMLFISLYALYALPVPCSKWVYSNNPAEKNKLRNAALSDLQCSITFPLFSIVKPTRRINVSNLFYWSNILHFFGRSCRPSSGVKDCTYCNRHMSNRYCRLLGRLLSSKQSAVSVWHGLLQYIQSLIPDDGRKDRLKLVQCYSNKINLRH